VGVFRHGCSKLLLENSHLRWAGRYA
jgi:hypothetical protein